MGPPDELKIVGDSLLDCVSSPDQLLALLDKLENLLSTVDQAPEKTVRDALQPSMNALISNELFRHSDVAVKISVASCIAEITRITAPDAPYDEEQMKEIFKLTVSAFEKLSDVSGRCYEKAILIVDNVARVRSCLLMMDLECDDLIIEMFQHFLRVIRSNHPHFVKFAMETIMTMVLNESEEISSDLLRPLLDSVRKENEKISPISWSLGEKVITNCADILQPYLMKAVQSMGKALDTYAEIVVSICQRGFEILQCNHSNGSINPMVQADEDKLAVCKDVDEQSFDVQADEDKLAVCKDVDEQSCDVIEGLEPDLTCVKDVAQTVVDAKPNKRNSSASTMNGEIIKMKGSKRQQKFDVTKNDKRNNAKPNLKQENSEAIGDQRSESEPDNMPKKRGRKPNSLMNPEEGYDNSWIHTGKKAAKSVQSRKACSSGCDTPPSENPTSGKDKLLLKPENVVEVSQPKTEETVKATQSGDACDNGSDPSPSKNRESPKDKLLLKPKIASELSQPKTKKTRKTAKSRKVCDTGPELSPSENLSLQKQKFLPKPEITTEACEGSESPKSQHKNDKNIDAACPLTNHSIPSSSHRKRGRPRKNSIANYQGVDPKSVSPVKEDNSIAQLKDNSLKLSSVRLIKDLKLKKDADAKAPKPLRKTKIAAKTAEKTALATESVSEMESKSCEEEEKPQSVMNCETENVEELRPLTQTGVKKRRRLDDRHNKDHNDSSVKTKSAAKTLNGETSQTRQRRKGTTAIVEVSERRDCNESLVGSRIKVWWPKDKQFYEGMVDSYDSVKQKHKILYADGDVETLQLKKERWELITDPVSPDAEQGIKLQQPAATASFTAGKRKRNSESESAKSANVNSGRRSRGRASAGKSGDNSKLDEPVVDDKSMTDPPRTKNEQQSSGKSRAKGSKNTSDTKKLKPKSDGIQKLKSRMT